MEAKQAEQRRIEEEERKAQEAREMALANAEKEAKEEAARLAKIAADTKAREDAE